MKRNKDDYLFIATFKATSVEEKSNKVNFKNWKYFVNVERET